MKCSQTWCEEDCRCLVTEREGHSPSARGRNRETFKYHREQNDVTGLVHMEAEVGRKKGILSDPSPPRCDSSSPLGLTKDVEDHVTLREHLDIPTEKGPSTGAKAQLCNTNLSPMKEDQPSCHELEEILGQSARPGEVQRTGADLIGNSCKPNAALVQLSPVSEVAKRMVGCSLKRVADEPVSPGPVKKRRLFLEDPLSHQARVQLRGQKRNVRKVKKELRNQSIQKVASPSVPPTCEIDFPTEWLSKVEGKEGDKGGEIVEDGSGRCPSTATNDP